MNPSSSLALIGPTGAGKTSLGRRLAAHYGLSFVDLDQEIEQRCGVDVSRIFEIEGEPGFRARESAALAELAATPGMLLATGAGAVLAAANRAVLAAHCFTLWLRVDVKHQLARLAQKRDRPLLAAVTGRRAKLEAMAREREPLYAALADLTVPGEAASGAVFAHAQQLLDAHWQRLPPSPAA